MKLDANDVEANFNIASLYLQVSDTQKALKYYRKCVKKDETPADQFTEIKSLFALQFTKAYFNIALIVDKDGDITQAMKYYQKAYDK